MRLIDADELMEHVWRDKLDSRELIAAMVENAPTINNAVSKNEVEYYKHLADIWQRTVERMDLIAKNGLQSHSLDTVTRMPEPPKDEERYFNE